MRETEVTKRVATALRSELERELTSEFVGLPYTSETLAKLTEKAREIIARYPVVSAYDQWQTAERVAACAEIIFGDGDLVKSCREGADTVRLQYEKEILRLT